MKVEASKGRSVYNNEILIKEITMCEQKIDLSDVKVGDEVRSTRNGWGNISNIDRLGNIYVKFHHVHGDCLFDKHGKCMRYDLYPEIVEVRQQKRKVEKSITGALLIEDGEVRFTSCPGNYWIGANDLATGRKIRAILPVHESWEEEE